MKYALIMGGIVSGFEFIGPFDTRHAAAMHSILDLGIEEYEVVQINPPDKYNEDEESE